MTIGKGSREFIFISIGQAEGIGILWTKLRVPFLESIIIQLKFKWVQVLVGRAVYTATVAKAPLHHGIFVQCNGRTWKEISVMTGKR